MVSGLFSIFPRENKPDTISTWHLLLRFSLMLLPEEHYDTSDRGNRTAN